MTEIKLQIVGWKKYQPQSDRIRHKHWFRVNMDCATSHGLFGLTPEQKWFWLLLLCECCRKDSDIIVIKVDRFMRLCEMSEKSIISAINILEENGTVSRLTEICQKSVSSLSTHNITEHNITDITEQNLHNITKQVSTELKSISVAVQTEKVSKDRFKDFFNEKLLNLYPQEYIDREKTKMEIWLVSNPQKNPKSQRGWSRFITGWLERGWDNYRKSLQSQKPKKKT